MKRIATIIALALLPVALFGGRLVKMTAFVSDADPPATLTFYTTATGGTFDPSFTLTGGNLVTIDYGDGSEPEIGTSFSHVYVEAGTKKVTADFLPTAVTLFSVSIDGLVGTPPTVSALTSLTHLFFQINALTGPFPDLSANGALLVFYGYQNQFTGPFPDLSGNPLLTTLWCQNNLLTGSIHSFAGNPALYSLTLEQNLLTGSIPSFAGNPSLNNLNIPHNLLTGSIPSFAGNPSLAILNVHANLLTGATPDLSANPALTHVFIDDNAGLTGYTPSTLSTNLLAFRANGCGFPEAAIDQILADFVGRPYTLMKTGCSINLSGGTNAAPSVAGAADKATLVAYGMTVTTN